MFVILLNPITHAGGGLFSMDHQIIDHNSKTAQSSTFKLGDFQCLFIRHILACLFIRQILEELKQNPTRGIATAVFEMRLLEKLNISIFCFT